MSYTGDPGSNAIDAVRFKIGDTDEQDEEVTDSEIDFLLTTHNQHVGRAALEAARSIAAKYAKKRDRNVGSLSVSYDSQFQRWITIIDRLKEEVAYGIDGTGTLAGTGIAELFGGGRSFLGPDDTPLTYNEGNEESVTE